MAVETDTGAGQANSRIDEVTAYPRATAVAIGCTCGLAVALLPHLAYFAEAVSVVASMVAMWFAFTSRRPIVAGLVLAVYVLYWVPGVDPYATSIAADLAIIALILLDRRHHA